MATKRREQYNLEATISFSKEVLVEAIEEAIENLEVDKMVMDEVKEQVEQAGFEEVVLQKVEDMMNNPCRDGKELLDEAVANSMLRLKAKSQQRWWTNFGLRIKGALT